MRAARQIETSRQRENAEPGYFSDGLSMHSHRSAQGVATPKMASRPYRVQGREHTLPELIEETRARIRHVQAELRITDDKERRRKLEASLDIKLVFLAKLKSEQAAQ